MKTSNILTLLTTALIVTLFFELLTFGLFAGLFYGITSELACIELYNYAMLFAPFFMFVAAILIYLDEKADREWKERQRAIKPFNRCI